MDLRRSVRGIGLVLWCRYFDAPLWRRILGLPDHVLVDVLVAVALVVAVVVCSSRCIRVLWR